MTISLTPDDRGNTPSLPPAELIEQPAIRQAVERHTAAREAEHAASLDATVLEQTRPQAVAMDRDAYADALEGGKRDPGQKHTDAHDKKVADAQRRADAARVVTQRAFAALAETVAAHEAEWAELVDKRLHDARQQYAAALDALAERHVQLAQASALAAYLAGGGRRFRPAAANTVELRRNAEPRVQVVELLGALRSLAEPPTVQKPAFSGPLRPVELGRDAA